MFQAAGTFKNMRMIVLRQDFNRAFVTTGRHCLA